MSHHFLAQNLVTTIHHPCSSSDLALANFSSFLRLKIVIRENILKKLRQFKAISGPWKQFLKKNSLGHSGGFWVSNTGLPNSFFLFEKPVYPRTFWMNQCNPTANRILQRFIHPHRKSGGTSTKRPTKPEKDFRNSRFIQKDTKLMKNVLPPGAFHKLSISQTLYTWALQSQGASFT